MERSKRIQLWTLGLSALALLCWVLMFMAGTDVWHDMGRPDFGTLGATRTDLKALFYAFYLLPLVLAVHLAVTFYGFVTARRRATL